MKRNLRYLRIAPAGLLSIALIGLMFFASPFVAASGNDQPVAVATYGPYMGQGGTGSVYGSNTGQGTMSSVYPSNVNMAGLPYLGCTHVVSRGETLFRIAVGYGTTVSVLVHANLLANPRLIFAGMPLRVPCSPMPPSPSCVRAVHVVQFGEDLFRIALRYNLSWSAVAAFNNLSNPNLIFAGMSLAIPCSGSYAPGYPPAYPTPTAVPGSGSVTVVMSNLAFNPANTTVHVGQMVMWVNNDTVPHTTTSGTCSGNVCTPMAGWDSGTLNPGQSFSHTFNTAGTFTYYCRIHGAMMQGTVTVTP